MRKVCAIFLLAVLSLSAAEHHGKVTFSGLPVPGATVTASQGTKQIVTITDQDGAYSFLALNDGTWKIRVEMLCFATQERDIALPADTAADWELKLLPMDQIRAAASAAGVATPRPAAASTPSEPVKQAETPRKGRHNNKSNNGPAPANTATGFQRTDVNASASNAASGTPGSDAATAGNENPSELADRAKDGFLINGASNNGASSPFALAPAFGNFRKGPGSLYNGMLGLTFDNSTLDARAFSITGQDTPKPAYNHLTGLASFGGPLKIPHFIKNGPNIVVNYQWTRNRNASTQPGLMPTPAERGGDLSQLLNPLGQPVQFFDPGNHGMPFPGNTIPLSRISYQASQLLNLFPLPNFSGGARYNYQIPLVSVTHEDNLQSRGNKTIGRKNQISGNFAFESSRTDNPNLLGFLDTTDTTGINAGVNWRHTFAPRLFGNFGVQYSRQSIRVTPFFSNRVNVSGNAKISGNDRDPLDWGPPALSFSGGIAGMTDAQQSLTRNQTAGVSYAGLWIRGRHNVAFGGDFRRQEFNLLGQQDARGTFAFTGSATANSAIPQSGSDFADFLLGFPDTSSIAFGNADKYFRASSYNLFATDDWRLGPGLTINGGIRWEYGAPIVEKYGRLVNLDVAPGYANQAAVTGSNPTGPLTGKQYPDSLIAPDKHGIEPRIGISWRPFAASSTIVRAGYGVYYNTSVYYPLASQMAQQGPLPNSKSLRVQNTDLALTLANGFPALTQDTFGVDPAFRAGYAQNWQLQVQRDLPGALVVTATYLGIKGTRGVQEFLPNTFPLGVTSPCASCAGYTYVTSNGNSTRQAAQLQLRRRLHNGFTASAQYTYSKSIDDAALGGRGQGQAVIAQNWLDLAGERGLSNFDQRHLLNLMLQYTTGMGIRGGTLVSGWRGALFKEWTVSTQITAGSGLPLTPIYYYAVPGTGVTGSIRPDYTGASVAAAPPGLFLNPAAYVPPASGQWGNAGRNSITGPEQFTLNASLGRTFRVSDRFNVDLRLDSANALNHVTFPSWNTTVNSAQFGLPGIANSMRSVQTTLRVRF